MESCVRELSVASETLGQCQPNTQADVEYTSIRKGCPGIGRSCLKADSYPPPPEKASYLKQYLIAMVLTPVLRKL